jgi:gliding motility-associated-like protein
MRKYYLFILFFVYQLSFSQKQDQSIGFVENKGQIIDQYGKSNNTVKYLLNTPGLNVQLRKNGFSYDVYETKKQKLSKKEIAKQIPFSGSIKEKDINPDYKLEYIYHRIDIDFINSNKNVSILASYKSSDYDNYYNVIGKPDGLLNVHKYKQITYQNIYPNIDVVFSIPNDSLKPVEYNFVVRPNGKVSDIQLQFKGAKTELVDNKIKMSVRFGEMEETIPMSWVENGLDKKEATISYKKIKKNIFGFESSEILKNKTIIIDPVPIRLWGTLYGDATNSYSLGTVYNTVDTTGSLYMTGTTNASNLSFATIGSHQTSIPISQYPTTNGIIVKFDTNGTRLWGTYYGGVNINVIRGIKADLQNNVIITGTTDSPINISTIGVHKENLPYGIDAFVAKFNSLGVRLWGSYFGGDNTENSFGLNIDNLNNIYLVGETTSTNGVAFNTNFQTEFNTNIFATIDAFIVKFSPNGNLIWGTYVGGEKNDEINAIAIKDNYLVIIGNTNSDNNIATNGVFQENRYNNQIDGFISKFSTDGSRLWSTYYGGEQVEKFFAVEIDDDDNIYIGGLTASDYNMTTAGSFQETNSSVYRGIFAKLSSSGSRVWGSYLGQAYVYSIIFKNNAIYLGATGNQYLSQNLINSCSYDFNPNYVTKGYIGKFSKNCDFIWGSFVGGDAGIGGDVINLATKISIENNNIYVSGITNSNYLISDSSSHQQAVLGGSNYYIIKFSENSANLTSASNNSPTCVGNTLNLNASGGTNYSWTGPNGFTSSLQNPIITNAQTINSGQYSCTITGSGGCDGTISTTVTVGDNIKPIPNSNPLSTITGDCNTIVPIQTATDNCAGTITATTVDPLTYSSPGTYTVHWSYDDGNGNIETQNQTVIITDVLLPTLTSPQNFCIQQNATLNDIIITGQNIQWYDAQTGGNIIPTSTTLITGTTYYASQTINGCESSRTPVNVTIYNTPAPTANSNQSFCSSQNATLNDIVISGSNPIWYSDATTTIVLPNSTLLQNNTTYYATQTLNGCESVNSIAITINLINTLNASNYSEIICDDLNDGTEPIDLNNYTNLLISGTGNTFSFYNSQLGAENQNSSDLISTNYNLTTGIHTIYVRIDSNNSCYQIVTITLELVQKPVILIKDVMPICVGNSIIVDAGSGFDTYLWSTTETTPSITINQAGNYNVVVTQNHGSILCSSTKNFTVVNSSIATISEIITTDWAYNSITVLLNSNSSGDYEYSIDGVIYQSSNSFDNLESGLYTVFIRDKNGCGITQEEIYLLSYPKYFTPNNDGYNDFWKIKSSEIEPHLTIKLFDRYGKFIKFLDTNSKGWDGTINGNQLPADDYWFVVVREDGRVHKGHFALKR